MILLVVLAIVLSVTVTIYQYDEQTKDYNLSRLGRKEASVLLHLDFEFRRNHPEVTLKNATKVLKSHIVDIAFVHNVDISLYNLQGDFMVSSNFDSSPGRVSEAIPSSILKEVNNKADHRVVVFKTQEEYTNETSYTYLKNEKNERVGVLKLSVNQDNSEQKEELKEFLSRLTAVYFLVFIIGIALSYFLSGLITRSIKTITSKMDQTRLHKRNEKIVLKDKWPELNILVDAYNKMIDELDESAAKLAQSEREQAWREMAKQVAHEIKNPLTPMRLSVQSFEMRFKPTDPNIEEKVREFSQTLIQQIDVMSSIANAFSDFAKMPKQKKELIEVVGVIKMAVDIFSESYIEYVHLEEKIHVNLDKTQLIRIVTNLIKNAVQAVENAKDPKVKLVLDEDKKNVIIRVEDNGKGIHKDVEHLIFEPKFTTKNSGMGLGLPMIKNIIEAYNGTITFTTKPGRGTIFTVILPKS